MTNTVTCCGAIIASQSLGIKRAGLEQRGYGGSFNTGALAGLAGDRISLGFLAETATHVTEHLDRHMSRLPETDQRSHSIVQQMRDAEQAYPQQAVREGEAELPWSVGRAMRGAASFMTGISYWF